MKTNTNQEKPVLVIFRKWPTGDVIALFPLIPADNVGIYCASYEHIGQHGASATDLPNTSTASPAEYAELKAELERIGYVFNVGKRIPGNAIHARRETLRAQDSLALE